MIHKLFQQRDVYKVEGNKEESLYPSVCCFFLEKTTLPQQQPAIYRDLQISHGRTVGRNRPRKYLTEFQEVNFYFLFQRKCQGVLQCPKVKTNESDITKHLNSKSCRNYCEQHNANLEKQLCETKVYFCKAWIKQIIFY